MNTTNAPRVSVIVPTHNRPDLLREALDSLCAQTFQAWEAVVVDDASNPPAAPDVGDARIRIIRHSSAQGGAAAKNSGIQNARGDLLAFLDDDDCYQATYLERAVTMLDSHPDLDVVFMGVTWFGSNGAWGQQNYDEAMRKFLAMAGGQVAGTLTLFDEGVVAALLKSVPMALQRPVVRRSALERIGVYRPDCLLWDCDWAIAASLVSRTALLSEGLYLQRADGQGYSSKRDRTAEQLRSNVEIKDRFWRQSITGIHPRYRAHFLQASADAWFDLAWHHYQRGERLPAVRALYTSARRQLRPGHFKLLARLLLPRMSPVSAS